MYTPNKLKALIALLIVLLSCPAIGHKAYAQSVQQGTLLLSPDTDCIVVFDGESLGMLTSNTPKKIKADFGDHILNATFAGDKTVKKIVTVNSTSQVIVSIAAPAYVKDTTNKVKKKVVPQENIDTATLTAEKATELYKAELLRPSPVDIGRLKYLLTKGVDIHTADAHGWTLLHEAAYQGDTDLLKTCIEKGLDINARSINSYSYSTPLSCANDQGHPAAARILLAHNAGYGIEDGYAEMTYDSGNRYKGDFKNGKKDGKGTFYYSNGTVYEGKWKNDKHNGKGTATFNNGNTYEGDWLDGMENGEGTFTWAERNRKGSAKYEGHFERNYFSGKGTLYYVNGGRYEGNFVGGYCNGYGKSYFADGGYYEGNWSGGQASGQGKVVYATGNKYTGNFENNTMNGLGVFEYSGGDRFEGNFANGKPSGKGVLTTGSGGKRVGTWVDGLQSGPGTAYFANGERYEGNFAGGLRDGQGTYYYSSGNVYEGHWLKDKKDGYGVLTVGQNNENSVNNCAKCKVYKGYWQDDVKHGDGGCYDDKGGLIYEGIFVNDYPSLPYPNR